ncbi:hypothetical protein Leryth_009811 [Lithospermum erythrorhizon]|nr:hypothetical protein Leryth_009811 [Lithospermum erythrorhizon]
MVLNSEWEARRAGLGSLAEVDEDGKEINPHIHSYLSLLKTIEASQKEEVRNQSHYTKAWYDRGAKIYQDGKFRKKRRLLVSGAMTHEAKYIAPDSEKIEWPRLDYDVCDRWNGYVLLLC